jgi:hypothetical protein
MDAIGRRKPCVQKSHLSLVRTLMRDSGNLQQVGEPRVQPHGRTNNLGTFII